MRQHGQHNNDERTQFFRKIYLTHFIRNGCERVAIGLCVRGELENEQTATYWSTNSLSLAEFLSRSAGLLNRVSWEPIALCWVLVLSTASYLHLTDSNYLNFLSQRVISLFDIYLLHVSVASAPNSTHLQWRLYPDIFDRMHLFLDWRLGRRSICYNCLAYFSHFAANTVKTVGVINLWIKKHLHCHAGLSASCTAPSPPARRTVSKTAPRPGPRGVSRLPACPRVATSGEGAFAQVQSVGYLPPLLSASLGRGGVRLAATSQLSVRDNFHSWCRSIT